MTTVRTEPDPTAAGTALLLHEALARSHQPGT
jgi:hypothetical protein